MIVYLSPHNRGDIHSGGVDKLFDHVDILTEAGFDARVAVGSLSTVDRNDLLVIPEIYGDLLAPTGIAEVSFNQNAHNTWVNVAGPHPYVDNPDLLAVMCVGQHNRAMLRYAFPDVRVERVALSVPERFICGEFPRKHRICYFGRKRANHARLVINLLLARGIGWEVLPLDGRTDDEVAAIMRSSEIFLSFSEMEGSPAPPREAMASGCRVIGYGMGADREFKRHIHLIAEDDVLGFAQAVEHEVETFSQYVSRERGTADSLWVRGEYDRASEIKSVVDLFTDLTGQLSGGRRIGAAGSDGRGGSPR